MSLGYSTGALTKEAKAAQNARYAEGHEYDFVIIGSGMASLVFAALAAAAGYRVCILEAHDTAGGYAHSFTYRTPFGPVTFCAQVHYIWGCGPGGHMYEVLHKLGLDKEITFELLDRNGYDLMVMPDGKQVRIPYGFDKLVKNIDQAYPGQLENLENFTGILRKIREEVRVFPDRPRFAELAKVWNFWNLLRYRKSTLQEIFDKCCLSKEAQAVLIAQAGDFMAPPEQLSIFAYTGLFGGYNTGAYYPTKHFNHMIRTIVRFIEDHGGHIYYETRVGKICVEGDEVTGLLTEDDKIFRSDRYICNMDPQAAARKLIGWDKFPDKYRKALSYSYSHTGEMLYVVLKGDLRGREFGSHNIWHLEDWDMNDMWRRMQAGDYSKPWVYLGTPTLHTKEPGIAPPGCSILEVGTLGSYDYFNEIKEKYGQAAYQQTKMRVRDRLLEIIQANYIPDLRERMVFKLAGSPLTNERFALAPRGNAYGSHLTPENMGIGRLKAETPFYNLFWCNASSGYGGIDGTTGTGAQLYKDLTGDIFYEPKNKPTDEELIELIYPK